jgi:hypothetical protein
MTSISAVAAIVATACLAIAALGLPACGDDDGDQGERTVGPDVDRSVSAPGEGGGEAILIKTSLTIPTGEVLSGSVIGDSRFCRGGTFRDEEGPPGVRTVLRTFRSPDGQLKIDFTPQGVEGRRTGPIKQSGPWKVVGGSGRFEGLRGHGQTTVTSKRLPVGRETFTGTVAR